MLVLTLLFAGCGDKKQTVDYNAEQLEQYAEMLISTFMQMDDSVASQFRDGSELQVNLMLMQTGIPVEKDAFVSMIDSWKAAVDECGDYIKHGRYTAKADANGVTLYTDARYEERGAVIEFKFDKKLNITSMDVSAKYTTGEILKKAGLNTILGMGTVFVVLIFLAFIISLLKYVPVLTEKRSKKEAVQTESTSVPAAAEEEEQGETVDDLELAAVITAAIAAQTGASSDDFVVRSIRRRPSNKWN